MLMHRYDIDYDIDAAVITDTSRHVKYSYILTYPPYSYIMTTVITLFQVCHSIIYLGILFTMCV